MVQEMTGLFAHGALARTQFPTLMRWVPLLLLTALSARADERKPSALEAWGLVAAVLEQVGERCGATVTGVHVRGAGALSGGPPVAPDSLPPAPRAAESIEVRQLTIQPGGKTEYTVELQFALRAADPVDGALMLEDLLSRFAAQPEFRRVWPSGTETWPLPDERGLMTGKVKLQFDLVRRPAPERELREGHHSIEHALRLLAQREAASVPGMRMTPKGQWLELAPVREARVTVGALHRLLTDAEACAPGVTVRGVHLEAPEADLEGPLADAWSWGATLEARAPGAASRRQSALEGLHLVMGLDDAFVRAGVSVEGFRPEYTYGGVRRRDLELSVDRQRAIETRAGYSIEVRGLTGTEQHLELSLFFDHPDGSVEATRLFEAYRDALIAQPEVLEVSLPAARVTGTGVEVHGLGVWWSSAEAVRPEAPGRTSGPATYLRAIAGREGVGLGALDVTPRGEFDYEVRLAQPCDRSQSLYDFLWSAETEEQGYLVTRLDFSPASRRGDTGWKMGATFRTGGE